MKIYYESSAYKDLKKIPKQKRQKIFNKVEELSKNPHTGKKLEGRYKGLRSQRVWPYRIVYEIKKDRINIYSVKHRQSSYI
jgi:addiction module RelE/StbE family toxin